MREGDLIDLAAFKIDFNIRDADGPPTAYIGQDEYYKTLVAGGLKREYEDYPFICTSEHEAISKYFKSLEEFLGGKQIIIWRTRPELVVFTFKAESPAWKRHYQVYSRLIAY